MVVHGKKRGKRSSRQLRMQRAILKENHQIPFSEVEWLLSHSVRPALCQVLQQLEAFGEPLTGFPCGPWVDPGTVTQPPVSSPVLFTFS